MTPSSPAANNKKYQTIGAYLVAKGWIHQYAKPRSLFTKDGVTLPAGAAFRWQQIADEQELIRHE